MLLLERAMNRIDRKLKITHAEDTRQNQREIMKARDILASLGYLLNENVHIAVLYVTFYQRHRKVTLHTNLKPLLETILHTNQSLHWTNFTKATLQHFKGLVGEQ